jgi:hypothetical protein
VAVRIPDVKLRLEDVAYLRGLANQNGARCELGESKLARLRLLGLIERADVPVCPKVVKEADEAIYDGTRRAREALAGQRWSDLGHIAYEIERAVGRKQPRLGDVITKAGVKLLSDGEVVVMMSKAGCR